MKVAILNANSTYGKPLVSEALKRGMDVTVFLHNENETEASKVVKKDTSDIEVEDLAGFDAVIDASGIWTADYLPRHYRNISHLCSLLAGTDTRFLIVGGANNPADEANLEKWLGKGTDHEISLHEVTAKTQWFGSRPRLEEMVREVAGGYAAESLGSEFATMDSVFTLLRKHTDVEWIYMEPSCEINMPSLAETISIPYKHYVADMLDELEHGMHFQRRISTTCD